MRSKLLISALFLATSVPSLLLAQTDRSNLQFYLGARFAGQATATFSNVGTIRPDNDIGDLTSLMNRTYADGYVYLDNRATIDGDDIPEDGRTNRWGFFSDDQVTEDGSGVIFSDFATDGEGQTVPGESEGSVGLDMEFALRLGDYGTGGFGQVGPFNWGMSFGFGLNDVNVRTHETLLATLQEVSDTYSLLGATAPGGLYQSPSTETISITNADGSISTILVDNSILMESLPLGRSTTSTPEGAEVDGYWEVDGSYITFRLGPWFRWRPLDRLSFRASGGVSATIMGATLAYDERVELSGSRNLTEAIEGDRETTGSVGYYGYLDVEFWITDVTGVYAGVTYESSSAKLDLVAGNRTASVDFGATMGFRVGITTHF